ncbi:Hsp20/alpha crystallin family protein [Candidatus Peregrinibacteria bacterium]|nr:Hsp20/alpha crystallin family protein [Candidatus Peregrinibacteria bacterium]
MKTIFKNKTEENVISLAIGNELEEKQIGEAPAGFGQLPIDVLENDKEILVIAPLAGVDLDNAEVIINNDVLTIRGRREVDEDLFGFKRKDYFVQECYWGEFSRSIILPPNADSSKIEATQKDHILYIKIPKKVEFQMRIVKIKSK